MNKDSTESPPAKDIKEKRKMKKLFIHNIGIITCLIFTVIMIPINGCQQRSEEYTSPSGKLTLALYRGDVSTLVYIAQNEKYFLENGLDIHLIEFSSGKQATDYMLTGEADVAIAGEFVFITNLVDNLDLRIIGTISKFRIDELIARRDKGIEKPEDLEGKKIAVLRKATSEFFLGRYLSANGLSVTDVKLIDLTPPEIVSAVLNGDVDAGQTWDPNIYHIKQKLGDSAVSLTSDIVIPEETFVIMTKEEWLKNNPEIVNIFLKTLIQAEDFVKGNPEETKEFITSQFNLEEEYVDYVYPKFDLEVELSQRLLVAMEDETRWAIESNLIDITEVPNYMDYIHLDALAEVKPEAVKIIR